MNILYKTKSLCPDCKKVIDASVYKKLQKVYMKKICKEHGIFNALVSSDSANYSNVISKSETTDAYKSKKKANIAILDINNTCNVNCPVCINDSRGGSNFSIESIKKRLDLYIKKNGKPEILQISGGEPTLHPGLMSILDYVRKKKIRIVMLNTNGVRIAEDKSFVKDLASKDVLVYLQFDGFKSSTYKNIRGQDLSKKKIAAIKNIERYGLRAFLASTIIKGINENEVGDIVRLGIKCRSIEGIDFHSVAYTGRCMKCNPMDRITMPDLIKCIEVQTNGAFKKSDFLTMPANDSRCCMFTYSFIKDNEIRVVPRLIDTKKYQKYFKDSIVHDPKEIVQDILKGKLSVSEINADFKRVVGEGFNPIKYRGYKKNVLKIMLKPFMDQYNFDASRVRSCNIHQIMDDGTGVPFCAYTSFIREKIKDKI